MKTIQIKRKKSLQTIDDHLPLGLIVHDKDGHPYVYVGYSVTADGRVNRTFRVSMPFDGQWGGWEYNSVHRATMVKRFPDLAAHWPYEAESLQMSADKEPS